MRKSAGRTPDHEAPSLERFQARFSGISPARPPAQALAAFLASACMNVAHGEECVPLYDGGNLTHWSRAGEGRFELEDGQLRTYGGMGLLWYTPLKFENVKIRIVYRNPGGSNAGVFIRIPDRPAEPWMPVNRGYEVKIDDRADEYHTTGVLYSFTRAKAVPPKREWNEMLTTLDDDRTLVEVNGVPVTDHRKGDPVPEKLHDYEPDRGPRPSAGYIGLQNHGHRDTVYFREISYQYLSR